MNNVFQAAAKLQAFCEAQKWRYCFIGGLALLRWGEPRETVDADLTLITGFGNELPYINSLLNNFAPRVSKAVDFAIANRVLLLRTDFGVGLDIALGALPFEESAVQRGSNFEFPGQIVLKTCSAEDLIVMKTIASRTKDWLDIEGIITRQSGRLNWNYIESQLLPLIALKEEPAIWDELVRRRQEFEV